MQEQKAEVSGTEQYEAMILLAQTLALQRQFWLIFEQEGIEFFS